jgi:hypothetical protein
MSETTYEQRQAVREYIVSAVTLICDNENGVQQRLAAAAATGVREGMGTGDRDGAEDYAAMLAGLDSGYERADYASVAGTYVVDELQEIIDEHTTPGSFSWSLLTDLLDLSDPAQAEMFGDHYLPESLADAGFDVVEDDE